MLRFQWTEENEVFDNQCEFTIELKNGYYKEFGTVDKDTVTMLFGELTKRDFYQSDFELISVEENEEYTAIKVVGEELYDCYFLMRDIIGKMPEDLYTCFIINPLMNFAYKHVGKNSLQFSSKYAVYDTFTKEYVLVDTIKEIAEEIGKFAGRVFLKKDKLETENFAILKINDDVTYIQDIEDDYKRYVISRERHYPIYEANKKMDKEAFMKELSKMVGEDISDFEIITINEDDVLDKK